MYILKVQSVVVAENRQRRNFDDKRLRELAHSIARNGLFHPIVIETPDNPRLIAGERRLRAITQYLDTGYRCNDTAIPPGSIPCIALGELTPEQRVEAELEENVVRVDLTWQEKTDALAKLHNLRADQARTAGAKPHTYTATAREALGTDDISAHEIVHIRHATLLQPFLTDPEVAKAATEREALSIVRRKLTQTFNEQLAKSYDTRKGQSPHALLNESCLTALVALPAGTFDVILVDPPYGIDAHKMSTMSQSETGVRHEYEDTFNNAQNVWRTIFTEGTRVCKPAAHVYMFCDFRHWPILAEMATSCGWNVWPTPIIWYKPSGGMLGDSTRGPRKAYETILFASRGDKRVTGVYLDVIVENPADSSMHAAAKPVSVYVNLLRRSVIPGDRVLDPCAGSGTIFPAANRLRCIATGIELSPTHYATALQRLGEQ